MADNAITSVAESIVDVETSALSPYYYFEPWDVEKRPEWVLEIARKDGIDLYSEEMLKHVGADPHPFQTGFLRSQAKMRAMLAGTQVGKSIAARVEAICMLTGEFPIALRYDLGVDTGVKRKVTRENVNRFGRRDCASGRLIDYKWQQPPESWSEWDCGNIVGVGKFPDDKIAPIGDEIWIGTFQKAMSVYWWPSLADPTTRIIPSHLIDNNRGSNGLDVEHNTIFLARNSAIRIITYDSGYQRFEAKKVWSIIMDEETLDERIFQSIQTHTRRFLSMIFTPYNGLTYTRDIFFPEQPDENVKVFHASMYDSPYQSSADIHAQRKNMKPWHIGARIWGLHTENAGEPYFDREKINFWIQVLHPQFDLKQFFPVGLRAISGVPSSPLTLPSSPTLTPTLTLKSKIRDNTLRTKSTQSIVQRSEPGGSLAAGNNMYALEAREAERDTYGPRPADLTELVIGEAVTEENNLKNTWKVYEDVIPGERYVLTADPAEGAEEQQDAQDFAAASIYRRRDVPGGDSSPILVASIRSTLETVEFARVCLYALLKYNNALLAAETKRAACNATFANELKDWPNWFKMTTINDATQKPRQIKGFDTNAATRTMIFDLVSSRLNEFDKKDDPLIPDKELLKELSACIVGKKGRPDHPKGGSTDLLVCFGIALYVFKNAQDQIDYPLDAVPVEERKPWDRLLGLLHREKPQPPVYLGGGMKNWR